jgi:HemY protein
LKQHFLASKLLCSAYWQPEDDLWDDDQSGGFLIMIKLLWRFGWLVLLAIGFAWLADRPGTLTMRWMGREIETSVVVAAAFALVLFAGLLFAWSMVRQIWRSPTAAREFWRFRKSRKGYEALSKGIIAAGAGDAQTASRNAAVAGNALLDEPLVNVLVAQAAQLKGDREGVKRAFAEMAKSPETELLGLRGLFAEARSSGDLVEALKIAEKAMALNPRLPWASTAVLQVQTARRAWDGAAKTLEQQGRSGVLDKKEAQRKRAHMLTAAALEAEDKDRPLALKLAYEAIDQEPGLVPALAVAARALIADGSARKAQKLLRKGWSSTPHPELAELMSRVEPTEEAEARFERVRDGVGKPDDHIENAVAIARAAMAARRTDVAREALKTHIDSQPQARVCALMAQVEEASDDKGRAREWLSRAINATRDPVWVSDGVASTRWMPVSPVTGEIVPCEWKAPYDMLPGEDAFLPAAAPTAVLPSATLQVSTAKSEPKPLVPDDPGVADLDD